MGATDSKLQFKNHLFRLLEEPNIPADDAYWVKVSRKKKLLFEYANMSIYSSGNNRSLLVMYLHFLQLQRSVNSGTTV